MTNEPTFDIGDAALKVSGKGATPTPARSSSSPSNTPEPPEDLDSLHARLEDRSLTLHERKELRNQMLTALDMPPETPGPSKDELSERYFSMEAVGAEPARSFAPVTNEANDGSSTTGTPPSAATAHVFGEGQMFDRDSIEAHPTIKHELSTEARESFVDFLSETGAPSAVLLDIVNRGARLDRVGGSPFDTEGGLAALAVELGSLEAAQAEVELARKVIRSAPNSEALIAVLEESGLANDPVTIRRLAKFAREGT